MLAIKIVADIDYESLEKPDTGRIKPLTQEVLRCRTRDRRVPPC